MQLLYLIFKTFFPFLAAPLTNGVQKKRGAENAIGIGPFNAVRQKRAVNNERRNDGKKGPPCARRHIYQSLLTFS